MVVLDVEEQPSCFVVTVFDPAFNKGKYEIHVRKPINEEVELLLETIDGTKKVKILPPCNKILPIDITSDVFPLKTAAKIEKENYKSFINNKFLKKSGWGRK